MISAVGNHVQSQHYRWETAVVRRLAKKILCPHARLLDDVSMVSSWENGIFTDVCCVCAHLIVER